MAIALLRRSTSSCCIVSGLATSTAVVAFRAGHYNSRTVVQCDAQASTADLVKQQTQLVELLHAHKAHKLVAAAAVSSGPAAAAANHGRRQAIALNVGVVGAAGLGKTTAIRALFGLPSDATPVADKSSGSGFGEIFYADIKPEPPSVVTRGATASETQATSQGITVLPSDTISLAVVDAPGYSNEKDSNRLVAALQQDAVARMRCAPCLWD